MRRNFLMLWFMACMVYANAQTIGVGTTIPDTSAVMDIFSSNKGVLIPRILDTATVSKPLEGLIIYNKNARSPYYYNGKQWLSLGGRLPNSAQSSTDLITYKVTGSGFSTTEEPILAIAHGISVPVTIGPGGHQPGKASFSSFSFTKELDINSAVIIKGATQGTNFSSIEFKFYASGSSVPYASYRFKEVLFDAYQVSGADGGGTLMESISFNFENYGFKDLINNKEFAFNVTTNAASTY